MAHLEYAQLDDDLHSEPISKPGPVQAVTFSTVTVPAVSVPSPSNGVVIVPAVATGSNGGNTGSGGHNRSKSRAANVLPATGPALPAEDNDEGKPSLIINTGPPITAIVPQTVTFGAVTPKPLAFGSTPRAVSFGALSPQGRAAPIAFGKAAGGPVVFGAPAASPTTFGAPIGFPKVSTTAAPATPIKFNVFGEAMTPRGTSTAIAFPPTPPGAASSSFGGFPGSPQNPFGTPRMFKVGGAPLPASNPNDFPSTSPHDFPASSPGDFPSAHVAFPDQSPFDPLGIISTPATSAAPRRHNNGYQASPAQGACAHAQVFRITYAPSTKGGMRKMTFPNGHTYADVGAQPVPRLGIRGLSEVASDGIMMEGGRLDLVICLGCHRVVNFDANDVLKLQEGYDRLGSEPLPPPPPEKVKVAPAVDRESKERVPAPLSGEGIPNRRASSVASSVSPSVTTEAKNEGTPEPRAPVVVPAVAAPPSHRKRESVSMTQGPNERRGSMAAAPSGQPGSATSAPPAAGGAGVTYPAPVATGQSVTAPGTAAPAKGVPGKKDANHAQYVLGYGMIDFTKDPNYADRDFNEEEQQRELKSLIVTNDLNENAYND